MNIKRFLFVVLLLLPAPLFASQEAPQSTPALWKVSSEGREGHLYLFGSIHFGSPALYPLPEYVMDAYTNSERLAVEMDPETISQAEVSLVLGRHGRLPPGQRLKTYLSDDEWEKLVLTLEDSGLPVVSMERLKPWMVAVQITAAQARRSGYSEGYGIDRYFLTLARHPQAPKQIVELETFETQMSLFDGLNMQEQRKFLLQTLRESDDSAKTLWELIQAWKGADIDLLETLIIGAFSLDEQGLYEQIFVHRNEHMFSRLQQVLSDASDQESSTFAVVGTGHMIGPHGLVRLFTDAGYTVESVH